MEPHRLVDGLSPEAFIPKQRLWVGTHSLLDCTDNSILADPLRKELAEHSHIKLFIKCWKCEEWAGRKTSCDPQMEDVVNLEREQIWTQEGYAK